MFDADSQYEQLLHLYQGNSYMANNQQSLQNLLGAQQYSGFQVALTSAPGIPQGKRNLQMEEQPKPAVSKPKEKTMFQEIKNDVKTFVVEHRGIIYFVALALLVDHFVFKGVFKTRLQAMAEKLVGKVEEKISAAQ